MRTLTIAIDTRVISSITSNYKTNNPKEAYDNFWESIIKEALNRSINARIIITNSMIREHSSKLKIDKDAIERNIIVIARKTKFGRVSVVIKGASKINSHKRKLEQRRKGITEILKKKLKDKVDVDIAILALNGVLDKIYTTDRALKYVIERYSEEKIKINTHTVNKLSDIRILFEDDP